MTLNVFIIIGFFAFMLFNVIVEQNMFKKVIFSSIMQSAIILYYIANVFFVSSQTPFYAEGTTGTGSFVDPVPQVLMLTAIVVGFATTALGLAMVVRIKKMYGTIMYNELREIEEKDEKTNN